MTIRPYHSNDTDALIQLWTDCNLTISSNNPRKDLQRKLAENPDEMLVAEQDGTVIGSCMLGYDGHRGWIYYLAVSPAHQQQGIARNLMQHAETLLRKRGCPKINLMVRESNREVIAFYHRIGYQQDAVITLSKRLEDDAPSA